MVYVRRLLWDPGNVAHIARHAVSPEEVEQACHDEPKLLTELFPLEAPLPHSP